MRFQAWREHSLRFVDPAGGPDVNRDAPSDAYSSPS
jgi:hypothetical protein